MGQGTLPAVLARANLVRGLVELGSFAESIACGEEAIQIAELVNHPASLLLACWAGGLLYLRKGNVASHPIASTRVRSVVKRSCRLITTGSARPSVPPMPGRADKEAVQLLEGAVAQDLALNLLSQHSLTVVHLAEAYLLAGQLEEAYTQAQYALEFSRAHQERGYEAYALRLLGEIAARGDPPKARQAEAHYQQALALAEELGMRPLQAHCHLGLGTLYATTGQYEQARAELSTAIELYHAMEMQFWLPWRKPHWPR